MCRQEGIMYLEQLPKQHLMPVAHTCICTSCIAYGACRDWCEKTAKEANVPVEWLAEQILTRNINSNTEIWKIELLYQKKEK
jgi:hypothetical protein